MPFSTKALKWRDTPVWLRVIWFGALTNFAVFWVVAVLKGGDAINGKVQDGRFFVGSHGNYTEVSKEFFDYSRAHSESLWITHPLALISLFWFLSRRKEPAI